MALKVMNHVAVNGIEGHEPCGWREVALILVKLDLHQVDEVWHCSGSNFNVIYSIRKVCIKDLEMKSKVNVIGDRQSPSKHLREMEESDSLRRSGFFLSSSVSGSSISAYEMKRLICFSGQ